MPNPNYIFSGLPSDWKPVTPNNTTDNLSDTTFKTVVGFKVSVGGNLVVTNSQGVDRTIGVTDGEIIPFLGATRVKSTGTTATGILVALA